MSGRRKKREVERRRDREKDEEWEAEINRL